MRWLALSLLVLNGLAWFAGDLWAPDRSKPLVTAGALPRVSTLKVGASLVDNEAGLPAGDNKADSGVGAPLLKTKPESGPQEPALPTCVRLGWFETAERARQAYRSLGRPGNQVSITEQERAREPLHWIIVPPQPEDRALRLFNELQRRGIDSYLVTSGENRNAISLGLFESKEAALRVLEVKKRQNLNAVLAMFPRNQISYALVFEVTQAVSADARDERFDDYRDDFEMVEISRCEGVATTPENP